MRQERVVSSRCSRPGGFLVTVTERVHGAALRERRRPQLARGLPQARRAVGDDQRRGPRAAGDEVAADVEPVLVALMAAPLQAEQDLAAFQRDPQATSTLSAGVWLGRNFG